MGPGGREGEQEAGESDVAQENEIGPSNNSRFGLPVQTRRPVDVDREYDWEYSAGIQHELVRGLSVSGSWFNRRAYNLLRSDNILVGLDDYTPVDIVSPLDGAVYTVYNLHAGKQGQVETIDVGLPIDQLPAWLNRALGIMILLVLVSYVAWVWSAPREIGQREWKVELPSGPSTLIQIGIGILDLGSCALAMYMLLPTHPEIGFVTMAVVFVSATLLGFASHAPGGLGVFDAAMLVALWQFDKESVLAGLLLFRLLYYLIPFALALAILGTREIWLNVNGSRRGVQTAPVATAAAPPRSEIKSKEAEKTDAG